MSRWLAAEILVPVGLGLVSLILSGYTSYTNNDKATEHRITVVETQQTNDGKTLNRIEKKVDDLTTIVIDRLPERK